MPSSKRDGIIVISWHPPGGRFAAGGFRRAQEIVDRWPDAADVTTIDAEPSLYRNPDAVHLTYPACNWRALRPFGTPANRLLQWTVAFGATVVRGVSHARRYESAAVYVPFSELPHCALSGFIVAKLTGSQLVFASQNAPVGITARLTVWLHNRADAITAVSETLRNQLLASGIEPKITVTRNGPPLLDVPPNGERSRVIDGLFVGRHTPEKGVFEALDVWESVCAARPGSRLVMIGPCTAEMRRSLEKRISSSMHLAGCVEIRGIVSEHDKTLAFQESKTVVATSRVEGWGFVPLEALQCGTPTVAWDLPAYSESLPAGDAIRLVPKGDVHAFGDAVLHMLSLDAQSRHCATTEARKTETSWDVVADAEIRVFRGELAK
jgi:glycosyltransferase involved in cell wall biosynthesis